MFHIISRTGIQVHLEEIWIGGALVLSSCYYLPPVSAMVKDAGIGNSGAQMANASTRTTSATDGSRARMGVTRPLWSVETSARRSRAVGLPARMAYASESQNSATDWSNVAMEAMRPQGGNSTGIFKVHT